MPEQWLEFNGYIGQVQFGDAWIRHAGKDWQHTYGQNLFIEHTTSPNRGRGLVIQANRDEFYLVGVNYRLFLRPNDKTGPLFFYNDFTTGRRLRVDEGHFDQNGEFQIDRRRNGDEIESGVWVDCMTVPLVKEVLTLHFRQRKTVEERVGNRYGLPVSPHFGQVNPFGQRMFSRYLAQAWSSGNTLWNSGRLVGNPRGSIKEVKS